jgi:glucuronate isomerase
MGFIDDNFLLRNPTAVRLYHEYAKDQPIIDYHCHLPPQDVATDRRFTNLHEIWLEGDHYKWRAMRTNGIDERYITGDATPWEKFLAFARTMPHCLRNPLYHWSHLELQRYFGISELLSETTAASIWHRANEQLQGSEMSVRGIFEKFKVSVVCTTDDPADPLPHHEAVASRPFGTCMYPTFRPDKAMALQNVAGWNAWVDKLAAISGVPCTTFDGFTGALRSRHDAFHAIGGRLSDHGLETACADFCDDATAAAIYTAARGGNTPTALEQRQFATWLMVYFGRLDHARGWTKQLHLGALRNANDGLFAKLGPDIGCDSVGDWNQGVALARYLGRLSAEGCLPKMVLYNLNPADNYVFATMAGNFQGGEPGKIQFGSGWWFLDQKEGMIWQLNALSNLGLLGRFVGMLTDSRSFMSFCRHEYFRRILCQLLGEDVANGELPNDLALLGGMVADICHGNAARHFGLQLGTHSATNR